MGSDVPVTIAGTLVQRLAEDVEQPAQRCRSHRHHDRRARVDNVHAASQTVGGDIATVRTRRRRAAAGPRRPTFHHRRAEFRRRCVYLRQLTFGNSASTTGPRMEMI